MPRRTEGPYFCQHKKWKQIQKKVSWKYCLPLWINIKLNVKQFRYSKRSCNLIFYKHPEDLWTRCFTAMLYFCCRKEFTVYITIPPPPIVLTDKLIKKNIQITPRAEDPYFGQTGKKNLKWPAICINLAC